MQFNSKKFFINSNSSYALLDDQEISMASNWELTFDNIVLSNNVKGRMYEITIASQDIVITFFRKVYMLSGLEVKKIR